jgi:hypothetical protein
MSLHVILSLTLLLANSPEPNARLRDADVARLGHELLLAAGSNANIERAAFVVRSPAGTFDLLRWPRSGFFSARWTGPVPEGVVAIIHTHPLKRPAPSQQDRAEAKRIGLPLYVVSRAGLCVADIEGGVACARRIPWLQRGGLNEEESLRWEGEPVVIS